MPRDGAAAIYAYWRESGEEVSATSLHLQAGMFAPLDGIVEGPATASPTAATLAPLATLGRDGSSQKT